MGRLPGYRTGSLSRNRHWSLRHCFNPMELCGDGIVAATAPWTASLRICAVAATEIEGGGGNRRTRLDVPLGNGGRLLPPPFLFRMTAQAIRLRHDRDAGPIAAVRLARWKAFGSSRHMPRRCRCPIARCPTSAAADSRNTSTAARTNRAAASSLAGNVSLVCGRSAPQVARSSFSRLTCTLPMR